MKLRGFTILELITVIAIIGILSTISFGFISSSQKRARDSKRKADLNIIAQSIDLYYSDSRQLPTGNSGTCDFDSNNTANPWIPGILQQYVPSTQGSGSILPRDPLYKPGITNNNYFYKYTCTEDLSSYTLSAVMENRSDRDAVDGRYILTR